MITSSSKVFSTKRGSVSRAAGFTLVEMMVTVVLFALIMASILPTSLFLSKSLVGVANYNTMSRESRYILEVIARDIHAADSVTTATASTLALTIPTDLGGGSASYAYDSVNGTVTRTRVDSNGVSTSDILLEDVVAYEFIYYNRLGNKITTNLTEQSKSVLVEAKLVKKAITTESTDYIISARFLMRNV